MGILYGHRCVLCGADFPVTTSRTLQLCPDCAAAVRREYRCNEVISIAGADGTIAPLYYRGTVRNAMKRFKFSSAAYCADWFAAQMSVALTARLEDWQPDLITYMPIGFLHYRKRGYNQAELLAKLTAKPLSLPCEATLRKRWFVGKQSAQKDYAARQSNAKDAVLPKGSVDLTGKSSCWSMILSPPVQQPLPPSRLCGDGRKPCLRPRCDIYTEEITKKDRFRGLFVIEKLTAVHSAVIVGNLGFQLVLIKSTFQISPVNLCIIINVSTDSCFYILDLLLFDLLAVLIQQYTTTDRCHTVIAAVNIRCHIAAG